MPHYALHLDLRHHGCILHNDNSNIGKNLWQDNDTIISGC